MYFDENKCDEYAKSCESNFKNSRIFDSYTEEKETMTTNLWVKKMREY